MSCPNLMKQHSDFEDPMQLPEHNVSEHPKPDEHNLICIDAKVRTDSNINCLTGNASMYLC